MKVQKLGHAVVKVRNLERSEEFYHGLLGIPIAARHETMPMTFFTLGAKWGPGTPPTDEPYAGSAISPARAVSPKPTDVRRSISRLDSFRPVEGR
jgi:catechol 2,3-dioxygenase-like lactoylglutathione lyase family enzyme